MFFPKLTNGGESRFANVLGLTGVGKIGEFIEHRGRHEPLGPWQTFVEDIQAIENGFDL